MKKIGMFLAGCMLLSSCESFLTEKPRTFLSPNVAYTTEDGLDKATVGLYDLLAYPFWGNSNFGAVAGIWYAGTDICEASSEGAYGIKVLSNLQYTSQTAEIKRMWDWYYKILTNAQMIIQHSEEMNWKDENLGRRVKGEAYFFRGFAHLYLTQFFGDVPMIDRVYSEVKLDWERTPKETVMALVIDDLKRAEGYLPDEPWQGQQGRLTKGAAQHLLAYAYLCNEEWDMAEQAGKRVISSGNYNLMTSRFGKSADDPTKNVFWDLFQKGNHNRDSGNREGLLVIQNEDTALHPEIVSGDSNPDFYAMFVRFFYPEYYGSSRVGSESDEICLKYGGRGKGYILATRYWLEDLFSDPNDVRGKEPCVQRTFYKESTGELLLDWDTASDQEKTDAGRFMRPYPRKWDWDGDSRVGGFNGRDATTRDFYLYRLAETYLIVAEALFRQGKNSEIDGAAYYINKVRTRAGASAITAADVTLDFILDERARELYGEIPRRVDLMRTGTFVERVNAHNTGVNGSATEQFNLLPIPQEVIDLNIDRPMENNPGW